MRHFDDRVINLLLGWKGSDTGLPGRRDFIILRLHISTKNVVSIYNYSFLQARVQLLKIFLKFFGRDSLLLGRRSFLNFRCSLETTSLENNLAVYITISPYIWCNICNVRVGECPKLDICTLFFKCYFCFCPKWTTTVHWH